MGARQSICQEDFREINYRKIDSGTLNPGSKNDPNCAILHNVWLVKHIQKYLITGRDCNIITNSFIRLPSTRKCVPTILVDLAWTTTITMTSPWAPWRIKSPASRLFAQPCVQAHKEYIKAPCEAFVRGLYRSPVDSLHKRSSNEENVSPWWRHHDVVWGYTVFSE